MRTGRETPFATSPAASTDWTTAEDLEAACQNRNRGPAYYERVPVRGSQVQGPYLLKIQRVLLAAGLLAHAARTQALRPGLTLIGDKGFAGREFEHLVTAGYGLHLIRPDRRDETPRHGSIGWIRQWIESVNDTLKGQLDLERHGGRTTAGVYARIAQRLLAMAAAIWHNWATAEPVKRSLIAYDH
jgi:hypothetical protein